MGAAALVKDVTAPLRSRRYRQKQRENKAGVTVTTADLCFLAGRLQEGHATPEEQLLAARLVLAIVAMMPPDSSVEIADSS